MIKNSRYTTWSAWGLLIGTIIGLFLDMYELEIYGAVGLGLVYTPIIALCLSIMAVSLFGTHNQDESTKHE